MQTDTSPGTVVHVDPPVARVDEPFRLTASGLPPGEPVTIRAATRDGELREWASYATFPAGDDGTVDVSTAAPLSGTYSGVDPTGLLWSMQPVERGPRTFFVRRKAAPLRVRVTVESGARELAACEVDRTFGVGLSGGGALARRFAPMSPGIAGGGAGSPGGIRRGGMGKRNGDYTKPAWMYGGTALPYVPARFNLRRFFQFYSVFVFR